MKELFPKRRKYNSHTYPQSFFSSFETHEYTRGLSHVKRYWELIETHLAHGNITEAVQICYQGYLSCKSLLPQENETIDGQYRLLLDAYKGKEPARFDIIEFNRLGQQLISQILLSASDLRKHKIQGLVSVIELAITGNTWAMYYLFRFAYDNSDKSNATDVETLSVMLNVVIITKQKYTLNKNTPAFLKFLFATILLCSNQANQKNEAYEMLCLDMEKQVFMSATEKTAFIQTFTHALSLVELTPSDQAHQLLVKLGEESLAQNDCWALAMTYFDVHAGVATWNCQVKWKHHPSVKKEMPGENARYKKRLLLGDYWDTHNEVAHPLIQYAMEEIDYKLPTEKIIDLLIQNDFSSSIIDYLEYYDFTNFLMQTLEEEWPDWLKEELFNTDVHALVRISRGDSKYQRLFNLAKQAMGFREIVGIRRDDSHFQHLFYLPQQARIESYWKRIEEYLQKGDIGNAIIYCRAGYLLTMPPIPIEEDVNQQYQDLLEHYQENNPRMLDFIEFSRLEQYLISMEAASTSRKIIPETDIQLFCHFSTLALQINPETNLCLPLSPTRPALPNLDNHTEDEFLSFFAYYLFVSMPAPPHNHRVLATNNVAISLCENYRKYLMLGNRWLTGLHALLHHHNGLLIQEDSLACHDEKLAEHFYKKTLLVGECYIEEISGIRNLLEKYFNNVALPIDTAIQFLLNNGFPKECLRLKKGVVQALTKFVLNVPTEKWPLWLDSVMNHEATALCHLYKGDTVFQRLVALARNAMQPQQNNVCSNRFHL